MNAEQLNQIHGEIGVDANGNVLYFSNIIEQPFIRTTIATARESGFMDIHANFLNTV